MESANSHSHWHKMKSAESTDCMIDLDQEWVSTLSKKVEDASLRKHRRSDPPTIFRVPAHMRSAEPDAFEPKIISFGPYHRGKPALKFMDELKLRYVRKLLCRSPNVRFEDLIKLVRGLEEQARASYSEDIDMGSNEFVEMMLFDGCFIVEIFLMQLDNNNDDNNDDYIEDDPILTTTWTMPVVEYDMLMLENQIPFFIIESVYNLVTADVSYQGSTHCSLIQLAQAFFNDYLPKEELVVPSPEVIPKFYHLLHFFHSCIMPTQYQKTSQSDKLSKIKRSSSTSRRRNFDLLLPVRGSIPSAARLREAGIKFKNREANSFLDVEFRDGVLEIPTLDVYDQTNFLFRNVLAFEQCFPIVGTYFATYAVLMDCLIDTAEDVALLHRFGCIVNGLGDDGVAARLFNRLPREVVIDYRSFYLAGLFLEVKKHTDSRWNKWRAKLMHDYFNNPWSVLSLVGAVILIFLTVIQCFLAVFAYFRPQP